MKATLKISLLGLFCCNCFAIYLTTETKTGSTKIKESPTEWTEEGIWGPVLERWVLTSKRETRVMQIPLENPERIDGKIGANASYDEDRESKISSTKIISNNNPPRQPPNMRPVSNTDLYLLGAIEKLVYKVDFMEKRLRRVEEMLYYVMAGNRVDQDPCPENYNRVGSNCYLFGDNAGRELDWKAASAQCKRMGATLAEFETIEENQDIVTYIQASSYLKGKDFWTGGLNPGLLWIWSNTARPVSSTKNQQTSNILGDGRCLRLAYNPTIRSYAYRGSDCSIRYHYICEQADNTSSNEIQRIGRSKNILREEL